MPKEDLVFYPLPKRPVVGGNIAFRGGDVAVESKRGRLYTNILSRRRRRTGPARFDELGFYSQKVLLPLLLQLHLVTPTEVAEHEATREKAHRLERNRDNGRDLVKAAKELGVPLSKAQRKKIESACAPLPFAEDAD